MVINKKHLTVEGLSQVKKIKKEINSSSKFNDQKTNFFEGNVSNYSKGSLSFDDF